MAASQNSSELRNRIRSHFNKLAPDYDVYKKKAAYYYSQLIKLLLEIVPFPEGSNILEVGCGTGMLLASLHPAKGLGVDISAKMIELATEKWQGRPELEFRIAEAETLELYEKWDVVILADVIEHLYDSEAAFHRLGCILDPGTMVVITWANHFWNPILQLLELLKMKMPEGEHTWESLPRVVGRLRKNGFEVSVSGTRCLLPAAMPTADLINRRFHRVAWLRNLGLIRYVIAEKST